MALAPGPDRRRPREPGAPASCSRSGCAATGRRSSSTTTARSCPELRALPPRGRAADEREPARERRRARCATSCCPTSATTRSRSTSPARRSSEATRVLGAFLRDVIARNPRQLPRSSAPTRPRRTGSPPSSRSTDRAWEAETLADRRAPRAATAGSWRCCREHLCQGWLEGYLLTGRHGLFNCYEAFIHIVDSMFNQHAKWLKVTRDIPWRRPIASLNYLLSSHVWRQDHNGFSHQDPGFIDHVVNKKAEIIRVYLPPDANTPALGGRPLPAQPRLRQRGRRRQAAGARLPLDGRRDRPLHPRARDLGLGLERRGAASPTSCSPAPATCRRSRRSPPPRSCASTCPS